MNRAGDDTSESDGIAAPSAAARITLRRTVARILNREGECNR
jgi:hypothetical protein